VREISPTRTKREYSPNHGPWRAVFCVNQLGQGCQPGLRAVANVFRFGHSETA
jgi:hypothetical protein